MIPQKKNNMTPEEYLEFEKTSELKHEYFDGEIFAMTGARKNHNLINTNIAGELRNQFKTDNSSCRVFSNDQRVKIEAIEKYIYPDIVVGCENMEFLEKELDSLINPVVIVEILSDSTEAYDRGLKFEHYGLIPSLQDYILVSQYRCLVERFVRREGGWFYSSYQEMDQAVTIESIGCELSLSEIYRWIEFKDGATRQ